MIDEWPNKLHLQIENTNFLRYAEKIDFFLVDLPKVSLHHDTFLRLCVSIRREMDYTSF